MGWHDLASLLFNTIIGYLTLLLLLKIMGKREIGQLSLFDLIILLSIADIMVLGIEKYDENLLYSIIPMVFLAGLQVLFALLSFAFKKFRYIIDGDESLIIYLGKVDTEEMKKNRYNMDDLYVQLRESNIRSISEVSYAILESNGRLNVFTMDQKDICPIPIIISGKMNQKIMKKLNIDEEWVNKQMKKQKITDIKQVLGATYNNGNLEFITIATDK